ncbi:MAG: bifunctional 2-C-methyl-D-erythritol 4-phosphate cytidylyltransferase/2-C-methyl-D-erythritol 2,4-cyclodiphosphate synthase [Alphaproteobacteria bacterium]
MAPNVSGPVAAIIVAGGRGLRAGGTTPKQYRFLQRRSILARSVQPFLDHDAIGSVAVVIREEDTELFRQCVPEHNKLRAPVVGGATRQESVRQGLETLTADPPFAVLIHDGARPFLTADLITRVINNLGDSAGVLPALPVTDTLKRANSELIVETTVSRDHLFAAQTPQGFRFTEILGAHRLCAETDAEFTDDVAIAEAAKMAVRIVPGEAANTKITSNEDIHVAEQRLAIGMTTRVGTGYDVHALGPGDHVILGGIEIPFTQALVGHSDADVVLHAITDALLGTVGDGDIGSHFPPSDPSLLNAPSDRFLHDATSRVRDRGGIIDHLDVTIIAEAPKIGPHREAMRERIAGICEIAIDSVSVKATTNERLGFVGRSEGIAALATATVRLPAKPNE